MIVHMVSVPLFTIMILMVFNTIYLITSIHAHKFDILYSSLSS